MNTGLQIVGTFLIGGALLNFILPSFMTLFTAYQNSSEINELYFGIGGKIHRKWYFLNILIGVILLILLTLIAFALRNWVIYILLLPYFLIIFALAWNNVYKRMNAITDNHNFSLWFTIIFAIWCMISKMVYEQMNDMFVTICSIVVFTIWGILFLIPSKKVNINE